MIWKSTDWATLRTKNYNFSDSIHDANFEMNYYTVTESVVLCEWLQENLVEKWLFYHDNHNVSWLIGSFLRKYSLVTHSVSIAEMTMLYNNHCNMPLVNSDVFAIIVNQFLSLQ